MKLATVALVMIVASAAPAASLVSIGVLDPTSAATAYSVPCAVSQDGTYVAGESKNIDGIAYAVVWSATDGLVALPCPSGKNTRAIGVVRGVGTNDGNIVVIGLHEGYLTQRYYKAPTTSLASGSWADCAQAGGLPLSDMRGGMYNDLRNTVPNASGWPPLGAWYTAGKQASNGRNAFLRGDPFVAWNGTGINNEASISAYAVIVGRSSDSPSAAFLESSWFPFTRVPGSTGFRADGIGISSSFGFSGTGGCSNREWVCGQVLNYNGANAQGFRWRKGDASMQFLGTLPGHTSSCAYTVADTGVTAGRSYISGGETAVVWDTSGVWDTTGQAVDIKALLAAAGVDTSAWSSLIRVYACSDDGTTLAGIGIWAADTSTRGFVATSPNPATPPSVVGACCSPGSCSLMTASECASIPGGTYLGDYSCCSACPGACCSADAPCTIETAGNCTAPRVFRGSSTVCDATTCQGACCNGFESCVQADSSACSAADFKGVGTNCEEQVCPCTSSTHIWADSDSDGDVDADDFGAFQRCYTGTLAGIPDGCACFERVAPLDLVIDGADFYEFTNCVTGPAVFYQIGSLPLNCTAP